MSDGDTMAQLAVVILLLGLAVPGLTTAYDYSGTPIEYEEEHVADSSETTQVDQSATDTERYGEEITITNGGTELVEGEDFSWDSTTGEITWETTANDNDTVVVQYEAYQRTGETELAWTVISPFFVLFGLFALISSIRVLWSSIAEVFA